MREEPKDKTFGGGLYKKVQNTIYNKTPRLNSEVWHRHCTTQQQLRWRTHVVRFLHLFKFVAKVVLLKQVWVSSLRMVLL